MTEVSVGYEAKGSQAFHIGAASCAAPGMVPGLEEAYRAYGSLPWKTLIEPAVELARTGVELTRQQAYLHAIVDPILRHSDEGRAIYGRGGNLLVAGDLLVQSDLAGTLETIAANGASALHGGALGRALSKFVREHGGEISSRDLSEYRVIRRRPIRARFLGHELDSNPPPSSGGVLIGYGLALLDRLGVGGRPGSAEAMARLVEIMREQNRARGGPFGRDLYRGGLVKRLYAKRSLDEAVERAGSPNTTHISVVDERGNAASLSATIGAGSGMIVPGTGIHVNNMLGELDLAGATRPGARITSMMAPSLVLRDGRPRLVVGSAGSVRLRGAILQIVVNAVAHDLPVEEAIARPRVHFEEPQVHCEGGGRAEEIDRLESRGYDVVRWQRRNLYFGGAAAVEMQSDGTLAAAGDPRRGGRGLVVR
jgi:gamma-glutamyltranspeptidase/glutathione hydrolase